MQTTFSPIFLDNEAIQFLFMMAHKTVEHKRVEDEITKEKSSMYKDIKHAIIIKSLTSDPEQSSPVQNKTFFRNIRISNSNKQKT